MYAVIQTGGKQHKVTEGEILDVEKLELDPGQSIDFNEVLFVEDGGKVSVGKPFVKGAIVTAEVVGHGRAKKVHILKFKRRKHHMKQAGHRQYFTKLKITAIKAA